ncbi:hypothetical protein F4808DRAFT_474530 [Astrocystis sublimbata]|nr:hypothetical protein F4808DRAFT_474530 [Astrocystis sublimbata]
MASAWSTTNSSNGYTVHVGMWTNWDQGSVLGKTLTLSKDDGATLISFTALFITFIASRFWYISSFIFHQHCATAKPRDALHHQRQAILRNAASATSALTMLFFLQSAWRNRTERRLYRVAPLMAFSFICIVAFSAASGLSSWITKAPGDEVLIRSSSCGYVALLQNLEPSAQMSALPVLDPYFANQAVQAETYAEQCYLSNNTGLLNCAGFVQDRLATTINNNADCPFEDTIFSSAKGNLVLDTGFIDSHKDLGLNDPADARIQMRTVLQCAPLKTQGYTDRFSDDKGNYTYYSFSIPIDDDNSEGFSPRDELYRTDGDIYILFLAGNGVLYWDPVDAPWYQAHMPGPNLRSITPGHSTLIKTYQPDEAASPVACIEQFQYCNTAYPRDIGCTSLGGSIGSARDAAPLFNTTFEELEHGNATSDTGSRLHWFVSLQAASSTVSHIVRTLGPRALASESKLYQGVQPNLPKDQWQMDMTQIWASSLAGLQNMFLSTAQGQADEQLQPYRSTPFDAETRRLCNGQKMRSAQYTSFSLFGLLFTFVTGVLIIISSFVMEPLTRCLWRRGRYSQYRHLEWETYSVLQLQRLGYEGVTGTTTKWEKCTGDIPVTESDVPMNPLDFSNPTHPAHTRAMSGDNDETQTPTKALSSQSSL